MEKKRDKRKKDHYVDFYSCSLGYQQGDLCKRKKRGRIRYLNWAVENSSLLETNALKFDSDKDQEKIKKDLELEKKVNQALGKLDEVERKFILYFYFDCFTYEKIASLMKKRKDKLQRIHQGALDKLKLILKDYVEKRFKLKVPDKNSCIICQSPHRNELDRIIRGKRKDETWKRIIKILKNEYNLHIKTPQILIGHMKKHIL
jgi:RNA polymerase sigma factor (sigma-70 family)